MVCENAALSAAILTKSVTVWARLEFVAEVYITDSIAHKVWEPQDCDLLFIYNCMLKNNSRCISCLLLIKYARPAHKK